MTLSLYLNLLLVQLHSWLLGTTAVGLTCLPCPSFLNPSPRNLLGTSPVLLWWCDPNSPPEFWLWWQSGSPRPADRFPQCWQPAQLPQSSKQHLLPDSRSSCHHGVLCWASAFDPTPRGDYPGDCTSHANPCNCNSSVWARPFPICPVPATELGSMKCWLETGNEGKDASSKHSRNLLKHRTAQ